MEKKALNKLDEFIKYDGNSLQSFIQFFELREILKSLYDDIEEAFYQTPDWARNFEERLARLEAQIEQIVIITGSLQKEPSKPHECKYKIKKIGDMLLGTCECGSGFSEELNLSKPVTEEKPIGSGHTGACKEGCQCSVAQWKRTDDKPSEFITPHKCVSDGAVYMSNPPQNRCKICGKFWYV